MGRVNVSFTQNEFDHIEKVARTRGISNSEYVREMYYEGKKVYNANENIDFIVDIIEDRLRAIIKPHVDRLAAISVKGSIMSSTSTFLNAQALQDLVPDDKKRQVRESYEKARLKGIAYVKAGTNDDSILD